MLGGGTGSKTRDPKHRPKIEPLPLRNDRRKPEIVRFNRAELNKLLDVYSRRVASGQWRDYAIDQRRGFAVFSIFRNSLERPLISVAKIPGVANLGVEYVVNRGSRLLTRTRSMTEVVEVLHRQPALVLK